MLLCRLSWPEKGSQKEKCNRTVIWWVNIKYFVCLTIWPHNLGISPSIDDNKLDLPELMTPQTATRMPLTTLSCIPDSVGVGEYGFHENVPSLISIALSVLHCGTFIVASSGKSSCCKKWDRRSKDTLVCAIMEMRSGKFLRGSWRILNVAKAERTPPAVSWPPSSMQVPKVMTATKIGELQKKKCDSSLWVESPPKPLTFHVPHLLQLQPVPILPSLQLQNPHILQALCNA
jgi:hypothetical protein